MQNERLNYPKLWTIRWQIPEKNDFLWGLKELNWATSVNLVPILFIFSQWAKCFAQCWKDWEKDMVPKLKEHVLCSYPKLLTDDNIHNLNPDDWNSCGNVLWFFSVKKESQCSMRALWTGGWSRGEGDFSSSNLERASTGQHIRVIQHLELIKWDGCASQPTTQIVLPRPVTHTCPRMCEHTHEHVSLLGPPWQNTIHWAA